MNSDRFNFIKHFLISLSVAFIVVNLFLEISVIFIQSRTNPEILNFGFINKWLVRSQIWNISIFICEMLVLQFAKRKFPRMVPYILMLSITGIITVIASQHYHYANTQITFVFPVVLSILLMSERVCLFTEIICTFGFGFAIHIRHAHQYRLETILPDSFISSVILLVFAVVSYKLVRFLILQNEDAEIARINAEKASKAKSEFLSNMSHEIRTPINSILGMNEMILRESNNSKVFEYAENIDLSGNTLLSLINDILDVSKIEAGKFKIVESGYSIKSLVSECCTIVASRIKSANLEFRVNFDPSLPSTVLGDEVRVRQILVNFLTNAAKYTKRGVITFSISGVRYDDNVDITFSVKDTGIGISEENLKKLFKSFERFDLEANRNIEGTGLGLKISKELADLMDAKIDVKSEYGVGSEFILNITHKVLDKSISGLFELNEKHELNRYNYKVSFVAPDAKILVVDDLELNLFVFKSLLNRTKVQIDAVLSGEECIRRAKERKYDAIFIDHMMPGKNGIEVFREICNDEASKNADTPAIMLTANALSGSREEYMSEGFVDYLAKPVQGKQLEDMLKKWLPKYLVEETDEDGEKTLSANERYTKLLDGASYDVAMEYCAGSEEVLKMVMKKYVESNFLSRLEDAYKAEDWKAYCGYAHSLKSTSRTLGMHKLGEFSFQLEMAAKEGRIEFIRNNHAEILEYYKKMLANVDKLVN